MFQIHGISISSNTTKCVFVAEELGVEYDYVNMDFAKGEHKSPEHLARHPLGKLPTLTHDGKTLFESGAICRYMAAVSGSSLYPLDDHYRRGVIDQWMNFFTCHLGKHFSSYAFEMVAKAKYGFGEPNAAAAEEALGYIKTQLAVLDAHLADNKFLAGDELSIADHYGFAYSENAEMASLDLSPYPAFANWYAGMKERPAIRRAHERLGV